MTSTLAIPQQDQAPWQLQMFSKSLKKKMKVRLLKELLGPLGDERCLLVTGGDNNGAMNYHLRQHGGAWTWAEMEPAAVPEMQAFLGDPVHPVEPEAFPFPDARFDRVVIVDIHEHLEDVGPLNREIARVLRPGGQLIVSTPNGDTSLPVAVLKRWVGMTPEVYGHVVQGFTIPEMTTMLEGHGFSVGRTAGYSRFFTELAELAINFAYVKVLSRKAGASEVKEGTIAPSSEEQLRSVRKAYRAYALVYPFMKLFSALDRLVPGRGGYALALTAVKAR